MMWRFRFINRLRLSLGLLAFFTMMSTQTACSISTSDANFQDQIQTTEVDPGRIKKITIPFESVFYSKEAADHSWSWEWSAEEDVPQRIKDKYEELKNPAPGGWMIGEADSSYFISVSIGAKDSVSDGFQIKAITFPEEHNADHPMLTIEVASIIDEDTQEGYTGPAFVRSLIRISKDKLPEGVQLNELSMVGS